MYKLYYFTIVTMHGVDTVNHLYPMFLNSYEEAQKVRDMLPQHLDVENEVKDFHGSWRIIKV